MKNLLACLIIVPQVLKAVTVSDVTVIQRWPFDKHVDIEYTVNGAPGDIFEVTNLQVRVGDVQVGIPSSALHGDVRFVAAGYRRITFDPTGIAAFDRKIANDVYAVVSVREAPLYMIVNLAGGKPGEVSYVTASELRMGTYGSCVTNPVEDVTSLVWTGVAENDVYKTDKLVLRHCFPGTFKMGARPGDPGYAPSIAAHSVTLTRDFYLGVFPVTQKQYMYIRERTEPEGFFTGDGWETRPVDNFSWMSVRNNESWPGSHDVNPNYLVGRLRAMTGGTLLFDLPTEAMWEYACRAGTETPFNSGSDDATDTEAVRLARYLMNSYDGGKYGWQEKMADWSVARGTAPVGSFAPNAWGFYDMHGNVYENCLDFYADYDGGEAIDPSGPASSDAQNHVKRGGNWWCGVESIYSYSRISKNNWADDKPGSGARVAVFCN